MSFLNPPSFWDTLEKPMIGLSPMDGVTDPCFRRIMALHGPPDLVMTEFLSVDGICHGARNALLGLDYHESERPAIAQLYGPNPETFFHVAQLVCELGYDGIDINMGCPTKKVCSLGSGAALIEDPTRAKAIIAATREGITHWVDGGELTIRSLFPEIDQWLHPFYASRMSPPQISDRRAIPVSVKTRIGIGQIVLKDWVKHLLEAQPAAISIHGRTLKQGYRGDANWEVIAEAVEIAKGSGTFVLGNGDIKSLNEAIHRIAETGVDGVLIGRAAMGNPWIFRRNALARAYSAQAANNEALDKKQWISEVNVPIHTRFSVALQHARLYDAMNGETFFKGMRKHLGSYCRGFTGAKALRTRLVRVNSVEECEQLMHDFEVEQLDGSRSRDEETNTNTA